MEQLIQVVFWVSIILVVHSYLVFPLILFFLAERKQSEEITFSTSDVLPEVAILMAVYNEEEVIEKKIRSILQSNYPKGKIKFYVGSDHSTDRTDQLLEVLKLEFQDLLYPVYFEKRSGKASIINELEKMTNAPVLILTDANVFFEKLTVFHLVKHFKDPSISVVGGNILNEKYKFEGISFQEKKYLERENVIKYCEGKIWGTMIGAFGGCFAIRKEDFVDGPRNFLVDDFYISMHVFLKGKKAINELEAICFEDVSNKISEEFRRKVRISMGNYQNLLVYKKLLWPPFTPISFCFFSHKVLRWFTPFLLIITLVSNFYLLKVHSFYELTLSGQLLFLCVPFLDVLLKKIAINLKIFRFITHFYSMNLALLIGFFKFSTGVKSNIWRPTERNQ